MLNMDDARWSGLAGGYRIPFDPRPLLLRLEAGQDIGTVWHDLWDELHHQGDIGEASYAAVPHLVRICRKSKSIDWNIYAMVAVIELARNQGKNPDVPNWLADGYFHSIQDLAKIGSAEVLRSSDPDTVRSILSVIALAKGLRAHSEFLVNYSEEEMRQIASGEWNPFI